MRDDLVQYLKSVAEERAEVEWDIWWEKYGEDVRRSLPVGWYVRLQQKGPRAAFDVLHKLGVSYTTPDTEPKPIGEGCCPLCGGEITDPQCVLKYTFKREYGGGGSTWRGQCRACDVDFWVKRQVGVPAIWYIDAPDAEWLVEPLEPKELQRLNENPPRQLPAYQSWHEFVRRARAEDEYWTVRFPERPPDEPDAIARVRRGVPVAAFLPLPAEFWESWDGDRAG